MSKPPIEFRPKQRMVAEQEPAIKPNKDIRLLAQLLAEKEARRVANVAAQKRFRDKQRESKLAGKKV